MGQNGAEGLKGSRGDQVSKKPHLLETETEKL